MEQEAFQHASISVTKQAVKRRAPEGKIQCVLQRYNDIVLAKVETEKITGDFPGCDINQCTVNRYLPASHLPEHSDDEKTINLALINTQCHWVHPGM